MLYREPKLLKVLLCPISQKYNQKFQCSTVSRNCWKSFANAYGYDEFICFSALPWAEIVERYCHIGIIIYTIPSFSALPWAEIVESTLYHTYQNTVTGVSVLYREPKLLKARTGAEAVRDPPRFQCSTVSRNCWKGSSNHSRNSRSICFSALPWAEIVERSL